VYTWVREFEDNRDLHQDGRGQHSKVQSPMDEAVFRKSLYNFVKENSRLKGKANLTLNDVSHWVKDFLSLEDGSEFSEDTLGNWLHRLGFNFVVHKKKIYLDGHERPDVVANRIAFIAKCDELLPQCLLFDQETLKEKENPEAKYSLYSQDEKIHHSNDSQNK
jgi:transposase